MQANTPVMLDRLANIDVVTLDGAVASALAGVRALRLLLNRARIAPRDLPHVLIHCSSPAEEADAQHIASQLSPLASTVTVKCDLRRDKAAAAALELHRRYFPEVGERERKTRILMLARRGGGGKPIFIQPFTGGAGTTCGAWTPVVAYQKGSATWIAGTRPKEAEEGATPIRGFVKGNYAQGYCPSECSYCFLLGLQGMGLKMVTLNLEDMLPEVDVIPAGTVINWAVIEHI